MINLSFGSTHFDPLLADAVLAAVRRGASSSPRRGTSDANSAPTYPANLPHVLTVGATDQNGLAAAFSSASDGIDLAAPASASAWRSRFSSTRPATSSDGTSFSAPIVAGAAALGLDGPSRARQHADLRPAALLGARHRAARLRSRDGLRDPRHPGRARRCRCRPRPARAERRRRQVKPGELFRVRHPPLTTPRSRRARRRGSSTATRIPTTSTASGFLRTAR